MGFDINDKLLHVGLHHFWEIVTLHFRAALSTTSESLVPAPKVPEVLNILFSASNTLVFSEAIDLGYTNNTS